MCISGLRKQKHHEKGHEHGGAAGGRRKGATIRGVGNIVGAMSFRSQAFRSLVCRLSVSSFVMFIFFAHFVRRTSVRTSVCPFVRWPDLRPLRDLSGSPETYLRRWGLPLLRLFGRTSCVNVQGETFSTRVTNERNCCFGFCRQQLDNGFLHKDLWGSP